MWKSNKLKIAILASILLGLLTPPLYAKSQLPAFAIGKKTGARNYLIFIWSADSVDSADGYRNIIRPLTDVIVQGQVRVVMMQIDSGSPHDHDTGPLLLCAKDSYDQLSMEYLKRFDNKFTRIGKYNVANTIIDIGPEFGLPAKVTSCHEGSQGRARRDVLAGATVGVMSSLKISSAPAYFLNSKRVYPSNADDVRSILRK